MTKDLMVLFPGQGSQFLGMGKFLFDNFKVAKDVFFEVNEALGFDLSEIIFGDDEKKLMNTCNAQPAIMCVSVALFRLASEIFGEQLLDNIAFVAGHSLGEYSALCCANSISLSSAAKLLKFRGEFMSKSYKGESGSMFAIIGLEEQKIREIIVHLNETENCYVANDNGASQIIISGHIGALTNVADECKKNGAKLVRKLNVNTPFHSPFMKEAKEIMSEFIKNFEFSQPEFAVISNVTANPFVDASQIKGLLLEQITSGVRWRESIKFAFSSGVRRFVEIGPGAALTNLIKRMEMDGVRSVSLYEKLNKDIKFDFYSLFD